LASVVPALENCFGPTNDSRNNTGLTRLPPVAQPDVWYSYNTGAELFPELFSPNATGNGIGPMGGPDSMSIGLSSTTLGTGVAAPPSSGCTGNVVEIQGLAGISVTEQRSKGFAEQLAKRCKGGIKIVASQPADFVPDKGLSVMENILQSQKQIAAVYTHDDDMGEGVAAAIENAGRQDEMWMTGAGGSKKVMEKIKEGGLWRATFLYNPSMSADAVYLASLLGQEKGLPGFAAPDIPSRIQLAATTVTKDNVDQFMSLGF
jgi:ABC-type sugar transport system substrate-binding protein